MNTFENPALKEPSILFTIVDRNNDTPLYLKAYRRLRELIVMGYFKNGDKLMSEAELAAQMGIGRTSLRTALVLLTEDGYIKTFQGKGTYVVYDPALMTNDYPERYLLPRERLVTALHGKTISHIDVRQFTTDYDSFLDETLRAAGDPVNLFVRNYTVDGNVAVLMTAYYSSSLLSGVDFNDFDKTEALLKDIFDTRVSYVDSTIVPAPNSSSRVLSHFEDAEDNFFLVSSLWYDKNDQPLVFTKDHYNGNYISYKMRTRK